MLDVLPAFAATLRPHFFANWSHPQGQPRIRFLYPKYSHTADFNFFRQWWRLDIISVSHFLRCMCIPVYRYNPTTGTILLQRLFNWLFVSVLNRCIFLLFNVNQAPLFSHYYLLTLSHIGIHISQCLELKMYLTGVTPNLNYYCIPMSTMWISPVT